MLQRNKMESTDYHKLCNSPEAFSRHELEQTLVALEKTDSNKKLLIAKALEAKAIEKPELHTGGKETDYILVSISSEEADEIIEALGNLEVQAVSPEGHTTALASHYAGLLDR